VDEPQLTCSIPLGFWAIATNAGEPYLERTSWTYFLRAIEWCRKYGIRILLDFHALPGSQNGWNHSGKQGSVNWMYGVMGIANAERSLEYLRTLVEFISQDGIKQVVPMIGLVNEVMAATVGQTVMGNFYYQAYEMIREITGIGSVNGPIIAIHEGFLGIAAWDSFLSGADRLALDQHPYQAFPTVQNNYGWEWQIANGCGWGGGTNDTQSGYGIVVGGEWSLAINDCGLWVNGVGTTPNYATAYGSCADFDQWMNYNDTMKQGLYNYAVGQMDSLQNWFFWTWKIGNSTVLGYPSAPQWHYQLGLQQGWIPKDPRVAGGWCKANGYCTGCAEFNGTFPVTATGAATSATIIPAQVSSYGAWPPTSMGPSLNSAEIAMLPTFTRTAQPTTLPMASPTFSAEGNGWYNAQDTKLAYTTVAGCPYPK
jgi:aryl-phospho-beta-D-glucosidase BglC (GH1 family)